MKKFLSTFLASAIVFGLGACSSGPSQVDYDKLASENAELRARLEQGQGALENGPAPQDTSAGEANESSGQTEGAASRKNPAKIGETIQAEADFSVYGHAVLEMKLVEVVRGEQAASIVAQANQFNDPAPAGKEYILAKFKVKNAKDLSGNDSPYEVNPAQFSFSNSKFSKEDQFTMVTLGEGQKLEAELYEGADTEGYVVFIADQGDACYAIYKDALWFALG